MVISFFSNYFNHHQKALCDSISSCEGVVFYFVETEPMEDFRKNMGWEMNEYPDYVIRSFDTEENHEYALKLGFESDLVIIGSAPEEFIEKRLEENKLIFRYTERPLKEGIWKKYVPRLYKKYQSMHYKNRDKNIYVLGASAYAAYDYKILKAYDDRILKFGYFPEGEKLAREELFNKKRCTKANLDIPMTILWTGRLLRLKHAELLLGALEMLKKKGIKFEALIVGNGPEEKRLKAMATVYGLEEKVTFMDFVTPDEVREMMRQADIYVCTSNHLEGWGSVIYEAASSGCAVVASHLCGSSPFIVKPNITGFLFKSGSVKSLANKLELLLKDKMLTYECGVGAYEHMQSLWNPKVAGERIVEFATEFLKGNIVEYEDGPLSKTAVLKNNWYRE